LSIVWSPDGQKCALLINGNPHAVFDFAARRGYSRAPMPRTFQQKRGIWPSTDHAWSTTPSPGSASANPPDFPPQTIQF